MAYTFFSPRWSQKILFVSKGDRRWFGWLAQYIRVLSHTATTVVAIMSRFGRNCELNVFTSFKASVMRESRPWIKAIYWNSGMPKIILDNTGNQSRQLISFCVHRLSYLARNKTQLQFIFGSLLQDTISLSCTVDTLCQSYWSGELHQYFPQAKLLSHQLLLNPLWRYLKMSYYQDLSSVGLFSSETLSSSQTDKVWLSGSAYFHR